MRKIIYFLALAVGLTACVSKKQYNDILGSRNQYYDEAQNAKRELADKNVKNRELDSENARLKSDVERLSADTLNYSRKIYALSSDIAQLNDLNTELRDKLGKSKSEEEVKLLLADLQGIKEKLQAKEDELNAAEKQLQQSRVSLSEKQKDIDKQQAELAEQSQKLREMTNILNRKDSLLKEFKNKVSQALVGFEGNGLAVTTKNGKVYVSLDEQLLFKSGKWDIDPKGVSAIEKLSKVLAENPDIQIVVEGHTDDVPYNGSGQITDNWDLSTKRATAITRILLKNKEIKPVRITAAGRSEFLPLDPAKTPEARQKNRRSEIILSPNLDELMELLSK
ncbi:MAG: OmpA family protein [Prevotellaceae bacterium]|jgi:chemotaxis protein MotB|nr:OmpA family protein [Prevotellaceae bacterium]